MTMNREAEKYIEQLLQKELPYEIHIANAAFVISDYHSLPPGKLTQMFTEYLLNTHAVKDKRVLDVGAGSFALGIIAAKNGAKSVIGTDINTEAIATAQHNIALNRIKNKALITQCNGLSSLLSTHRHQIDLLLCGPPWDTITLAEYDSIPNDRKMISRAFYDIDDTLISDVFSHGFALLSPQGKIYITASLRIMNRIERLCQTCQVQYKIVWENDIHGDGNNHYILEIRPACT